jgi:hypothetical protein
VKSIVGTIAITGGAFDLTAKIPTGSSASVGDFPPAIGYPNTDVHSDIGLQSVVIRGATSKVDAAYLIGGANASPRLQSVTFSGEHTRKLTK